MRKVNGIIQFEMERVPPSLSIFRGSIRITHANFLPSHRWRETLETCIPRETHVAVGSAQIQLLAMHKYVAH